MIKCFGKIYFENPFTPASLSTKSIDSFAMCSSSRECFLIDKEKMNKINDYCKLNNISCYHFFMSVFHYILGK